VTWTNTPSGQPTYISGRRVFAVDGSFPPGDGFTISSGTDNRNYQDVAYNFHRNEYLVTWDVDTGGVNLDIYGIRLRSDGVPLTGGDPNVLGEFPIAGWPDDEERPAAAACYWADHYMVAWQTDKGSGGTEYAIYTRYLNGEAVPEGVYLVSDTPAPDMDPDVACDFEGLKFLLAWQDKYAGGEFGLWARWAFPEEIMDPEFELMGPRSQADREYVAIAGGQYNLLTAWEHDRDGGTNIDIYGRLLGYMVYLSLVKK